MIRWIVALSATLLLAAAPAAAFTRGASVIAIGLQAGAADVYSPQDLGGVGVYLAPDQLSEPRAGAEFWHLFSDDYALAISAAMGLQNAQLTSSFAGDPELEVSVSSFTFRVGGDRVGRVGTRFIAFMGPGIEIWTGNTEAKNGATVESESVTRVGISGRAGGYMMLAENVGIVGHVGHTIGRASVDDGGAETTWWSSGSTASLGIAFGIGVGR